MVISNEFTTLLYGNMSVSVLLQKDMEAPYLKFYPKITSLTLMPSQSFKVDALKTKQREGNPNNPNRTRLDMR